MSWSRGPPHGQATRPRGTDPLQQKFPPDLGGQAVSFLNDSDICDN